MTQFSPNGPPARPGNAAVGIRAGAAVPNKTIPLDTIVADKVSELEDLYQKYGDNRFRAAARALVKPPSNHSPADHKLDLDIMRVLTRGPNAMDGMAAARKVAEVYPPAERRLIVKRLWEQFQRHGRG